MLDFDWHLLLEAGFSLLMTGKRGTVKDDNGT
jgi:hypothetical protein